MSLWSKRLFRIFIFFLITYSLFARIDGWPDNSRLDLTRAIVDEGTFRIDNYAQNTGDRAYYDGHYYTDKFPGASFIAVPPYFMFKYIFGLPTVHENFYNTNPDISYNFMVWFVVTFTSALFSALTVILVYKTTGYFTNKRIYKYLAAFGYGFGTMAFNYATLFFDHAISTFFSFLAFYILYGSLRKNNFSLKILLLAALFSSIAVLVTPFSAIIVLGLCFFLFLKRDFFSAIIYGFFSLLIFSLVFVPYSLESFEDITTPYYFIDRGIFHNRHLLLEHSACYGQLLEPNHRKTRYLFGLSYSISCDINVSKDYFEGMPLDVKNSVGERMVLYNKNGSSYFYNRSFKTSNSFLNFRVKAVRNGSIIDFYEQYGSSDKWIYSYRVVDKNYSFKILSYKRGTIKSFSCPRIFNSSTTRYCYENISTFEGLLFHKYNLSYTPLEDDADNSSNFRFQRYTDYSRSTMFHNMFKLLFYPYRGLFVFSPFLILFIIGLFFMSKEFITEFLLVLGLFIAFLFVNAIPLIWWGGTSFGPRHMLPVVPFLFIPIAFSLKKIKTRYIFILLALSILINLAGLQTLESFGTNTDDGQLIIEPSITNAIYSWNSLGNPLLEYYFPLFIKEGPQSMLLEKILRFDFFPFINLIILFIIGLFLFRNRS